jgi:hypothetical protein
VRIRRVVEQRLVRCSQVARRGWRRRALRTPRLHVRVGARLHLLAVLRGERDVRILGVRLHLLPLRGRLLHVVLMDVHLVLGNRTACGGFEQMSVGLLLRTPRRIRNLGLVCSPAELRMRERGFLRFVHE